MRFFARLFRSSDPTPTAPAAPTWTVKRTTVHDPSRIDNPVLGFLNVRGSVGAETMRVDRQLLASLFGEVRESQSEVPRRDVLFLYGDVGPTGKIAGRSDGLRDIIKAAGAYVAVVASDNPPDHYMKCLGPRDEWTANITLTIDRRGDKLPQFFAELFRRMYAGESMPVAWVELAPQIPGHGHPDAPETIMAAEAGHLVFGKR